MESFFLNNNNINNNNNNLNGITLGTIIQKQLTDTSSFLSVTTFRSASARPSSGKWHKTRDNNCFYTPSDGRVGIKMSLWGACCEGKVRRVGNQWEVLKQGACCGGKVQIRKNVLDVCVCVCVCVCVKIGGGVLCVPSGVCMRNIWNENVILWVLATAGWVLVPCPDSCFGIPESSQSSLPPWSFSYLYPSLWQWSWVPKIYCDPLLRRAWLLQKGSVYHSVDDLCAMRFFTVRPVSPM